MDDRTTDPLDVYLKCALTLQKSCEASRIKFEVLTNDPDTLNARLDILGHKIDLRKLSFNLQVPKGIPFYEAHFKLDAIRALGSGDFGEVVGLIDLDVVITEPLSISGRKDELWVYDLTETINLSYGSHVVTQDLALAGSCEGARRWFGGEFILGHHEALKCLSAKIEQCWPVYLIPSVIDQNPCAHVRLPIDMIFHGRS